MLSDARLVHEQAADSQHWRDFVQRRELTTRAAAQVITRTEVDHEIEAPTLEWKCAYVADVKVGSDIGLGKPQSRRIDEGRIDVDCHELLRIESFGEHGKRDPAPPRRIASLSFLMDATR